MLTAMPMTYYAGDAAENVRSQSFTQQLLSRAEKVKLTKLTIFSLVRLPAVKTDVDVHSDDGYQVT